MIRFDGIRLREPKPTIHLRFWARRKSQNGNLIGRWKWGAGVSFSGVRGDPVGLVGHAIAKSLKRRQPRRWTTLSRLGFQSEAFGSGFELRENAID